MDTPQEVLKCLFHIIFRTMNDSFEQEFYDVVSNPDVFTDEKFHNQLEKKTPNKIQDQVHEQLNVAVIRVIY